MLIPSPSLLIPKMAEGWKKKFRLHPLPVLLEVDNGRALILFYFSFLTPAWSWIVPHGFMPHPLTMTPSALDKYRGLVIALAYTPYPATPWKIFIQGFPCTWTIIIIYYRYIFFFYGWTACRKNLSCFKQRKILGLRFQMD